jgi:hypothetical protein
VSRVLKDIKEDKVLLGLQDLKVFKVLLVPEVQQDPLDQ